jgi:hypothetical protein
MRILSQQQLAGANTRATPTTHPRQNKELIFIANSRFCTKILYFTNPPLLWNSLRGAGGGRLLLYTCPTHNPIHPCMYDVTQCEKTFISSVVRNFIFSSSHFRGFCIMLLRLLPIAHMNAKERSL